MGNWGVGCTVFMVFVLSVMVTTPKIARTQTPAEKAYSAQHPPYSPSPFRLRFGAPKQTEEKQVTVALELAPWESDAINIATISTQIPLPDGPWRFQKAESPKGSRIKVTTRLQREEETSSDGRKRQTTILYLNVVGGERPIPAGIVAQLNFSLVSSPAHAGSLPPLALALRKVTFEHAPMRAEEEPPPLEPPAVDPPANPSPTCFFFTH